MKPFPEHRTSFCRRRWLWSPVTGLWRRCILDESVGNVVLKVCMKGQVVLQIPSDPKDACAKRWYMQYSKFHRFHKTGIVWPRNYNLVCQKINNTVAEWRHVMFLLLRHLVKNDVSIRTSVSERVDAHTPKTTLSRPGYSVSCCAHSQAFEVDVGVRVDEGRITWNLSHLYGHDGFHKSRDSACRLWKTDVALRGPHYPTFKAVCISCDGAGQRVEPQS